MSMSPVPTGWPRTSTASRLTGSFTSMPDGLMLTSATRDRPGRRARRRPGPAPPRRSRSARRSPGPPARRRGRPRPGPSESRRGRSPRARSRGFTSRTSMPSSSESDRYRQRLGLGGTLHVVLGQVDAGRERLFADRVSTVLACGTGPRPPEVAAHHDRAVGRVQALHRTEMSARRTRRRRRGRCTARSRAGMADSLRCQFRRRMPISAPEGIGAGRRLDGVASRPAPRDRSAGRPRHGPGRPASGLDRAAHERAASRGACGRIRLKIRRRSRSSLRFRSIRPRTTSAIEPVSSLTTTMTASVCSLMPIAARCRVP